jgi:NAD(P)-dependent dehydrogenase (short-subunit alcohol dehydrogenase family)
VDATIATLCPGPQSCPGRLILDCRWERIAPCPWSSEQAGRGGTSDSAIGAYATSKHAVVGLMRTAAKEMAAKGIRVNSLHPGPTDSEFQHAIEIEAVGASREESAKAFEHMIPLARHATPDEIAQAVVFLASDESAFMTGHTLTVDGGLSI